MRVPLEWLHEYCRPPLDTAQLAERLTMIGLNVESIAHHGVRELDNFRVGRVLEAERHPDADRLTVCRVDLGRGETAQIVCGAPNVAAGQTVAVARPGAVLPDGRRLERVKLRGVESDGMILAEDELAIGTEHAGIVVLKGDHLEPGSPLADVLAISGEVLELEITSNRPDCLGIYGIAREAHAATGAALAPPPWAEDPGQPGDTAGVAVTVECGPELCPRFTARVFDDVKIGPSPPWLKARLSAAGQRPISNVVDITNYVMLLTGQPLHAFDLDQVAGARLNVREARDGESLETLDGVRRTLRGGTLLIEDAESPTSIAGVMGGARSEVGPQTTRVLMEVATWNGPSIHRTAWDLGLQSEASLRFEKQLQPEQAMQAQAVATRLMVELCGARLAPGTIDVGGDGPPPTSIPLRDERVTGLLGHPIPRERCASILRALEFATAEAESGLEVSPPAHRRGDITREVDLIEEVARLDGLDKLPATLPSRHGAYGRLTPRQRQRRRAADILVAQGLQEVVGWSFTSPDAPTKLRLPDNHPAAVELANPLSREQSQLRTNLIGSLLDVARLNRARGSTALRLFETGAVYLAGDPGSLPREPYDVAAILIGPVRAPTWREPSPRPADFFAVKGVVQGLLDALGAAFELTVAQAPFIHPGRAASVWLGGEPAGWMGELHPLTTAAWDIDEPVAAFELNLDALPESPVPQYADVTSFPGVREDLAVVVGDEVSAKAVRDLAVRAGAPLLHAVEVFDVYRDPERLGEGKVSLALRLEFRAPDRTLTDAEVADQRARIIDALERELDGRVRV